MTPYLTPDSAAPIVAGSKQSRVEADDWLLIFNNMRVGRGVSATPGRELMMVLRSNFPVGRATDLDLASEPLCISLAGDIE